jgi:4a-hydroxytetrahydrobiopterin dehydratase
MQSQEEAIDMSRLTDHQISEKLKSMPGWAHDGEQISRVFAFDSFMQGIEFVDQVAEAAEEQDHHPDIDIRYTDIKVSLSSHDAGGITDRDFRLAQHISEMT